MDDKTLLQKRSGRAIKELLIYKEAEVDQFLPSDVSARLRKEILDQINGVVDTALRVLETNNDLFMERLERAQAGE